MTFFQNVKIVDFCFLRFSRSELTFPRKYKEVVEYLEISSAQYVLHKHLDPLVKCGAIRLTIPDKP